MKKPAYTATRGRVLPDPPAAQDAAGLVLAGGGSSGQSAVFAARTVLKRPPKFSMLRHNPDRQNCNLNGEWKRNDPITHQNMRRRAKSIASAFADANGKRLFRFVLINRSLACHTSEHDVLWDGTPETLTPA